MPRAARAARALPNQQGGTSSGQAAKEEEARVRAELLFSGGCASVLGFGGTHRDTSWLVGRRTHARTHIRTHAPLLSKTNAPAACALAATSQLASGGTSPCKMTAHGLVGSARPLASAADCSSNCAAVSAALAPAATMIWFSPLLRHVATVASAVLRSKSVCVRMATLRRLRPAEATCANASSSSASSPPRPPTRHTISTVAPAAAAAYAWLAPFPPAASSYEGPPRTVSPGCPAVGIADRSVRVRRCCWARACGPRMRAPLRRAARTGGNTEGARKAPLSCSTFCRHAPWAARRTAPARRT